MTAGQFDLRGQIVVVTGGSQGIGRELTMLLASEGACVVPTCRSQADADSLKREAEKSSLTVHPGLLDVRSVDSIASFVERTAVEFGTIDVLVNNAGLGYARGALDVGESDWDEMMSVNLRGVFFASQAVARVMIEHGGGRIINMSSQGGLVGLPDAVVYCASKGGVNMLTKALALEWAHYGITVNAIAPTFIRTPGTAPILNDPVARKEVLDKIPLGQFGTAADVAGAVIYLATSAARLVTGTVLVVDGGWTAQ